LKSALDANVASLAEGEVVYAKDEDRLYVVEGGVLVATTADSVSVSSLEDLSDASGYHTVGAMAERPTFDAAWPGTFPNLASDSWAFGTTGNISGPNLYVDDTPAGFDPSPNQYTKWRMTFDGSHTYIINCADVVAQDGGARYVWSFSSSAGSGIDGVASEQDDFFAMRNEVLTNGWNTGLRIEAIEAPSAGQALIWNGDRSQFEPETLASDVTSVNTQTGAVSLGISDLDDTAISSTQLHRLTNANATNVTCAYLGGYAATGANYIQLSAQDADGNSMQAWITSWQIGDTMSFYKDGVLIGSSTISTLGPDEWGSLCRKYIGLSSNAIYLVLNGYTAGDDITLQNDTRPDYAVAGSSDGQVLTWVGANSQWEAADLQGAAVRLALGIGEYVDDAAAGTGGVASGAMYYNTTSSDYRLKA